jgi:hypothetical protein
MTEALGTARLGPSGSAAGEDRAQTMSIAGAGRARVNGTGKPPHERGTRGDGTTLACACVVRFVVVEPAAIPRLPEIGSDRSGYD